MRVILLIVDSLGVGSMPDAANYNDEGSNTLGNIAKHFKGDIKLPYLSNLGMGCIIPIEGVPCVVNPSACYGKGATFSAGKDTTTGHWEIAGIHLKEPFPVFPKGFPLEVIKQFESKIGKEVLGNKAASGTEIIKELGEDHLKTGQPIVYTSADSVFQLAAHEEVVDIETIYEWCKIAREILKGDYDVSRVIARPFIGKPGSFVRTSRRKDFSLAPPEETLLDILIQNDKKVFAVGKISDIFAGKGITKKYKTVSNLEGLKTTRDLIKENSKDTLIFTNLVDFDMVYGHRNDVKGYKEALEELDTWIPKLKEFLKEDDLLIITADHGCDPTWPGSDHTREYVPILIEGQTINKGVNLGTLDTLADIGATIQEYMNCPPSKNGQSFLSKIQE